VKTRFALALLGLMACSGAGCFRASEGPNSAVRVSVTSIPVDGMELEDVTVRGEALGQGIALADAMSDILERALARGGNYVVVDYVDAAFEVREHTKKSAFSDRTIDSSVEVAVTTVHARVFRVPKQAP
jgi:hypothetical protein